MLKPINSIKKFVSVNSRDYRLMLNKPVWDNNFKDYQLKELNFMEDTIPRQI